MNWDSFLIEYIDPRWPGTQSLLIKHNPGGCVFLQSPENSKVYLCRIHTFKPSCCLDWKPGLGQPECRRGLEIRWNLTCDPSGTIGGPLENLKEFEDYLNSLIHHK
jgi:hypothetical protein